MTYTLRGPVLYDHRNRRIAVAKGMGIYNDDNQQVAIIRGNRLFDSNNLLMMSIRGAYIYDAGNKQVALLSEAENMIKGATSGMLSVALWYCFIR
jgi:hypothetical protein